MSHLLSTQELQTGLAERRKASRFPVRWPIKVRGVDNAGLSFEECGELGNLSSGGALVHLNRKLQVGAAADVFIRIPLKGESWMKFPALVTRVEVDSTRHGPGFKFSTCRPEFLGR